MTPSPSEGGAPAPTPTPAKESTTTPSNPPAQPTTTPSNASAPVPAPATSSSTSEQKPKANGASMPSKTAESKEAAAASAAPADAAGAEKLSPAELKKRAKAEKAARRAKVIAEKEGGGAPAAGPQTPAKKGGPPSIKEGQTPKNADGPKAQKHVGGSGKQSQMRRGSVHGSINSVEPKKKRVADDKNVAVFGHLYGQPRRTTIAGAGKEVHPAVLALGLQMRDYVICGSNARCVATLLAFKRVIDSYTTPVGTSLARHLTTHLSHQITYLSTCRPLSISQGNAIRALKLSISSIDPSVPEETAKADLCDFIDSFIREKITVADQVIANSAALKINDGDVILTFACSSIVKKTILTAHNQGKKFRVIVIDSRPLFEGKSLARTLANAGIKVQYSLTHAISHAAKDATKVLLGAHAMMGNGRLYSRVGTALVAMSAKERAGGADIPVIVCCETVKFTDRVALDSIVVNEISDADELVISQPLAQVTSIPAPEPATKATDTKSSKSNSGSGKGETAGATGPTAASGLATTSPLQNWRDTPNLQLLNIMYDVTPAKYLDMVVTEMGSLPPSAVPIVHRMSTNS
ncbi:hypothetical protein FQN54_006900 [Arachnomyces sp. PD_36]|nr:hypothetical protein FQN54_006900 [Arachnomyces sp. PD_36]